MSTNYIPLNLPTLTGTANFSSTANFLAAAAGSLVVSGNSFIQNLVDNKNTDFFSVGDIPAFFSPVFYSGGIGANAFVRPDRPNMTPANLQALFDRINNLTAPTAPVMAFTYTDPGYVGALRDPMIAKLLADLINGGYGIDNNDETNLWNRERDREAAAAQSNIDELKRQAATLGFAMPQGSLYAAIQRARQDYLNKISSVNRDIGLKRADLYVDNRRKVIEQVLSVESQNIALYNAIQGRAIDIQKTQIQMAIALFEAGIRYFEATLAGLVKQVEAQMEFSKTLAVVYNADIAMYSAYVGALVADSNAFLANQRNILDRDKAKLFASVDQVKFRLQQLAMGVDNSKDVNKFGSEFFRTALGATLNGISGLAVQTTTV